MTCIICFNQYESTDPEALGLAFHRQGPAFIIIIIYFYFLHTVKLLQTWLMETEVGLMICLFQITPF